MWEMEYHEAGAITEVLSRGHGRIKKGALKATSEGSSALFTSALMGFVCSSSHLLPCTVMVCCRVSLPY